MTWTPVLWLLAFVPALLALYFLKLRRRSVPISSTILWKRALEEYRVNAPFRRLRLNWLLVLQLLALVGLILAVWRPRTVGLLPEGRDWIILLDQSASVAAVEADGPRIGSIRREALEIVEEVGLADRVTLLAFSSRTVPLGPASSDKTVLAARIRALEETSLPTDLDQALRVAASIAETLLDPSIIVVGDGCYGDVTSLPPEVKRFEFKFVGMGTALENVGIVEADVRRSYEAESRTEVFALVQNGGATETRRAVSLFVEGDLRDAREVVVPPGGSETVVFDATDLGEGIARVLIEPPDALTIDDEAWIRLRGARDVSVLLVGPSNPWIELVLRATSGVRHRRVSLEEYLDLAAGVGAGGGAGVPAGGAIDADVAIFDRNAPPGPPVVPSIYVGCVPPLPEGILPPQEAERPAVIDWDRTHPVNRFLSFADVYIEAGLVFRPGGGLQALVECEAGAIIAALRHQVSGGASFPVLLVGFDILATNWPVGHYSYPIFFANALEWLGSVDGSERSRWRTGEALVYRLRADERLESLSGVRCRLPSGRELPASVEAGGSISFSLTVESGVYDLVAGDVVLERFPVSLLDPRESRLAPATRVEFGDFSVDVTARTEKGERDLWRWFALGALLFVMIEWYVYHRRMA